MKYNQTGLLFMSIGLLSVIFFYELDDYIQGIGVLGGTISSIFALIGIILHFKNLRK